MAGQYAAAREALQRFRDDHADDPLCAYVLPYLGEIALQQEDPDQARTAFSDALQQFPDGPLSGESRYGLARSLESLGDVDGAVRFYRYLADADPPTSLSDDSLLQVAILSYRQEQYDVAIEVLRKHLQRFPGSDAAPQAAYWLGLSLTSAGKYAEAGEVLSAAADRYPAHKLSAAMAFAAGDALCRNEQASVAHGYFQRVIEQHGGSDWADDALQMLVQLAWQQGDCPQVQSLAGQFERQYATSPLRNSVRQLVARAWLKQGQYQQAIAVLEPMAQAANDEPVPADRAVQGESGDNAPTPGAIVECGGDGTSRPADDYYLALAYLGAERYEDALALLDKLKSIREPRELVDGVKVARASTLLGLKRYEQAIEALQVYLASEQSGPDVEKCRAQLLVTCAAGSLGGGRPSLLAVAATAAAPGPRTLPVDARVSIGPGVQQGAARSGSALLSGAGSRG